MLLSSRTSFACGFVPALLSLTACGGSSDTHSSGTTTGATTTTGLGTGGAGTTTTTATGTTTTTHTGTGGGAAVPPGPQVVTAGGPVLKAPKVQLIAYASDPFVTDVEAFITELGATTEWASQTAEYGVGAFTKLPTILIPGTPPSLLDDNSGQVTPFETTLANNVSGASPVWAPEDGSTMYMFLLPLGTDISAGGNCCSGFLGYHYEAPLATGAAPYGVICHCPQAKNDPLTPLQYVTTTVSHEMVETATDPFTNSNPAFLQSDDADAIWTIATGGEIADMCEYNTDSNYQPPGATYMLQRSWSNAAAKAGTDPCVPVPDKGPYFVATATYSDSITLQYAGAWKTKGVKIPVGQSRTIPVVLSGQTSGPWTVKVWDLNGFLGSPANTVVSLDKTSGSDGDVLQLTIKVNSYDSSFGGAGFVLESTLNGQDNLTYAAVGQ